VQWGRSRCQWAQHPSPLAQNKKPQAQYGVSTASPDQQAAQGTKPSVMDRVIIMHVDGRIQLQGEVRCSCVARLGGQPLSPN